MICQQRKGRPTIRAGSKKGGRAPQAPLGDIRMIVRGTTAFISSKKARKTYLRMVRSIQLSGFVPKMARVDNPIIKSSVEDGRCLHHPYDNALVLSIQVGDYNTHRVLIDNEISTDILYYLEFQ